MQFYKDAVAQQGRRPALVFDRGPTCGRGTILSAPLHRRRGHPQSGKQVPVFFRMSGGPFKRLVGREKIPWISLDGRFILVVYSLCLCSQSVSLTGRAIQ